MEITGQILKQNREKAKISLSEVSMATKINLKVLEAIESGDKGQLPAASFLRGFVRTYAKYLKLDETMIMQSFDEEIGSSRPKHLPDPSIEAESEKPEQILHSQALSSKYIAAGTIVILIFTILVIRKIVDKYEKEALLPTTEDIHQIAKIEPPPDKDLPDDSLENNPKMAENLLDKPSEDPPVKQEKSEPKNTVESVNPNESHPNKNKNEEALASAPELVPVKKPTTPVEPPLKESTTQQDTSLPKQEVVSQNEENSQQELIIEALDNTRIQMILDNGKKSSLNLKASDVHIIKAQSNIQLILNDGGAVSIIHNGQNRGVPGDLGKSLTLNFN